MGVIRTLFPALFCIVVCATAWPWQQENLNPRYASFDSSWPLPDYDYAQLSSSNSDDSDGWQISDSSSYDNDGWYMSDSSSYDDADGPYRSDSSSYDSKGSYPHAEPSSSSHGGSSPSGSDRWWVSIIIAVLLLCIAVILAMFLILYYRRHKRQRRNADDEEYWHARSEGDKSSEGVSSGTRMTETINPLSAAEYIPQPGDSASHVAKRLSNRPYMSDSIVPWTAHPPVMAMPTLYGGAVPYDQRSLFNLDNMNNDDDDDSDSYGASTLDSDDFLPTETRQQMGHADV